MAFCTAHVVPGHRLHATIRCSPGRIHSYVDTQITRLGGPNFHEIPINAPVAQVHNNQRDGMHRQAIHRGRVAYEPNSLGGGCPFQAGSAGFVSFPEPIDDDKVRGKPEKFADHYTQATLFWSSQTPVEQAHIVAGVPLRADARADARRSASASSPCSPTSTASSPSTVAEGLGIDVPAPLPRVARIAAAPEVEVSPALSLLARPPRAASTARAGRDPRRRRHARRSARLVYDALGAGAAPYRATSREARHRDAGTGDPIAVDVTLEAAPSVLFDAVVLPDGGAAMTLASDGHAVQFVKDAYRHCKPILSLGAGGVVFLERAGIPQVLPDGGEDPGVLQGAAADAAGAAERLAAALGRHRFFERETDPPRA